ncbi:DUF368 domain-containing protein [Acetivibrio sp. MSJd-27]|uniref:DUF368 domain-containing protein n=1 Tax=Acetivibrio sp. MSJd-27 TaxID=2841523 RepID=UPI001C1058F8|nr:DUF368 domain-containing protein [Acetivibrio sp. MSJd-27]MBU5449655.1 DUF368 domain-containing protein [Acetivibrio sp. MSJd-27]
MKKNTVQTVIKGVCIGASMLIPGVSGGTMAIILGEYDKLVHAVSTFRKDMRNHTVYLLTFLCGGLAGVLLFARLLLYLVECFEKPMMFLFLGAVLGSIPMLFQKTGERKVSFSSAGYVLLGILIVLLLGNLPSNLLAGDTEHFSFIWMGVFGFIIAIALVLPGISASYMLLMLGLYDLTLQAISRFDVFFLLPLGIGAVAGILLTTGVLEKCMQKHPKGTFLLIIGFVCGAVPEIFPGIPSGWELAASVILFFIGYGIIRQLGKMPAQSASSLPI